MSGGVIGGRGISRVGLSGWYASSRAEVKGGGERLAVRDTFGVRMTRA